MTQSFDVHSVEETWALARRLAATLKPGDIVCLEGDLGAGKTTFTQGLAAALDMEGRVNSPTFCLVQEHKRRLRGVRGLSGVRELSGLRGLRELSGLRGLSGLRELREVRWVSGLSGVREVKEECGLLVHMDLYRLKGEDDVLAIGWEDYLTEGAVLVVEWPERAGSLIPENALHVRLTHGEKDEDRHVDIISAALI